MPTSFAGITRFVAAITLSLGAFSHFAAAQVGSTYQIVAFTGQSAPGGGTYGFFGLPRIGANGAVGFVNSVYQGEGQSSNVVAGIPGSLRLVASSGDTAPGTSFSFDDFQDVSVSKDGLVAFNADASGDGSTFGIWAETASGLVLGVDENSGSNGGLYISALGPAAFRSSSIGAKGQNSPDDTVDALFFGAPGAVTVALEEGQTLDGNRLQTIYDTSTYENSVGTSVDVNETGSVAFKAVASPSATPAPREIIYVGSPTAPRAVATQGQGAPGISESTYADLSATPSIAANGLIAFSSTLNAGQESRNSAIFAGAPGALAPIILEGATVPTTSDVTFRSLTDTAINSSGDVVFRAVIRYSDGSTRTGIWLKRLSEAPVLIAVSGIDLPTPTGTRQVSDVDFAGTGTFNDLNEFVFRAEFSNGDQGIYLADTQPGAPTVHITKPGKPRDRVTMESSIIVAGTASDVTGVAKVEYTVTRETSASKRDANGRGKRFVTTRVKLAKGATNWSFKVPLSLGLNLVSIVATDKLGNQSPAYKVRLLRYQCDAK